MMKKVLILGGGAGGVVVASRLAKRLRDSVEITLVDKNPYHEFRPSYLWVTMGIREPDDVRRPLSLLGERGIKILNEEVRDINPAERKVKTDKRTLDYDYLVVALGAELRPDLLPGAEKTHHAWELDDALRLREAVARFKGGKILVGPASVPYRCSPAPFELALMLRYLSEQRGISEKTEITVFHPWRVPMEPFGPFMQNMFKGFLEQFNVEFIGSWETERIDDEKKKIVSRKGDELEYDLAVVIPPHRPARPIEGTDLINKDTGYMNVSRKTLRNPKYDDVFGVGDIVASTLNLGMAGVFAHFEGDFAASQIIDEVKGTYMAMTYNKTGVCVMDVGYLGAAVFCDFSGVIDGVSEYPECWVLGGMKAFRGAKVMFEKMWFAEIFGR